MTAIGSLTLMLHQELRINWRMMTARASHKAALWSLVAFLVVWHLVALPVPFPARDISAAVVAGDRLLLGTSGYGVVERRLGE